MARLFFLATVLAAVSACVERPAEPHALFDGRLRVDVPAGYTLQEDPAPNGPSESAVVPRPAEFVRLGGHEALSSKFPDYPSGPEFLDHFAGKDVQARIAIAFIPLVPSGEPGEWNTQENEWIVPRDATPRAIHDRFCESFTSRWSEFSFAYFDPETEIGRCVNFAGAFVTFFTRRVDDSLVLVHGIDFVELLLVERKGPGKAVLDMSPAEKWQVFRAAANADAAEQVLLSAEVR